MQPNFLREMQCCRSLPCPAGKATAENPAGSGILPRKLKRCPRKATARSANQHSSRLSKSEKNLTKSYVGSIDFVSKTTISYNFFVIDCKLVLVVFLF
ncbi:hypothetical protein GH741_09210 [Aquibacillus halophilus]|uniref:Uncharacterized protein n=1 Tax=Aquibacillus halophilus TaxID=930132 RepID=A0A6A8DAY1_9BACI|nr:hypothetical protein [Aquibacillus halophilus]MRH42863.1 hypothetical protein [Aquibacillus halophilus]